MNRFINWLMVGTVAICLVQFVSVATAADRVLVPGETDLPFYVRGTGHTRDGQIVGAVFYRPFETAPGDITINQMVFVDPALYPLNVEGFLIRQEGPPMVMHLMNQPGKLVEMAFFSAEEFFAAQDGGVTIDEIRAMTSLILGYADFFLEVQQPLDRDVPGYGYHHTFLASGVLEDGRSCTSKTLLTGGTFHVDLTFGDQGLGAVLGVPEPLSLVTFGGGILSLLMIRQRRS